VVEPQKIRLATGKYITDVYTVQVWGTDEGPNRGRQDTGRHTPPPLNQWSG
jgi:hypothetical protein